MRFIIPMVIMIFICVAAFSVNVSIRQIQYTTVAGTGSTYPSSLLGQTVSTSGIVTGIGFTDGRYVIADSAGAWHGIFVNDSGHTPVLGDRLDLTGVVTETTAGCTELSVNAGGYSLNSSGNTLPAAADVTPASLAGYPNYPGEAYEGVLVKLTNVSVTLINNKIFYVKLFTGPSTTCQVTDGFYPSDHVWSGVVVNQIWSEITGIVNFGTPNPPSYRLNPRSNDDLVTVADINSVSLKMDYITAKKGAIFTADVKVSLMNEDWNVRRYTFRVAYNKRILQFLDADIDGTLSDTEPALTLAAREDSITVNYVSSNPISNTSLEGILLKLKFKALSYGESSLMLSNARFYEYTDTDTIPHNFGILTNGNVTVPIVKKIAWLSVWKDNYNKTNIFNPWLNEKITIEYGCLVSTGVASSKAIIRIYDIQGRLVATPVNKIIEASNGIEYYVWNGRDVNKNLLPIGTYYCHAEIIDRVTGRSDTAIQPIVVAAELK